MRGANVSESCVLVADDAAMSATTGEVTASFLDRTQHILVKLEFHDADTDTDILARIIADTSDTRDFPKLFL